MKLLLHTCCAPCLIYPLQILRKKGFEVTGLFYNPNIHPYLEYNHRRQVVEDYSKEIDLEMIYADYQPQEFFRAINPVINTTQTNNNIIVSNGVNPVRNTEQTNNNIIVSNGVNMMEEKLKRCPICWYQRLKMTAQLAQERGYTHFSSTLLVSPYQNQESLNKIGCNIADQEQVKFYYEDFRIGFRKAHQQAKAYGIYCQNYCGCIYSQVERCQRLEKH